MKVYYWSKQNYIEFVHGIHTGFAYIWNDGNMYLTTWLVLAPRSLDRIQENNQAKSFIKLMIRGFKVFVFRKIIMGVKHYAIGIIPGYTSLYVLHLLGIVLELSVLWKIFYSWRIRSYIYIMAPTPQHKRGHCRHTMNSYKLPLSLLSLGEWIKK